MVSSTFRARPGETWPLYCILVPQSANAPMRYKIRPVTPADQSFLWEMLYQSLYVPQGNAPFERDVVKHPDIARYVKDWGRKDDAGLVAVDENNRHLGAVWLRLLKDEERGFGYVDSRTPELGIAVLPEYRGNGIGADLLSRLIEAVADSYESISLSVAAENPALRLYQRLGFKEVGRCAGSITMMRKLEPR